MYLVHTLCRFASGVKRRPDLASRYEQSCTVFLKKRQSKALVERDRRRVSSIAGMGYFDARPAAADASRGSNCEFTREK